ncbi:uncharacterized protein V1510DRAFT_366324 [Dipodascopsis tothii]|uniref:uncharacterized protein n=1 Tax=Dipodascopsis tothii TaxID=44089 RepID=UPI0034CFCAFC
MSSGQRRPLGSGRTRKPVQRVVTNDQAYQFAVRIAYLTYLTAPKTLNVIPQNVTRPTETPARHGRRGSVFLSGSSNPTGDVLPSNFLKFMRKEFSQSSFRNMSLSNNVYAAFTNFSSRVSSREVKDQLRSDKRIEEVIILFTTCTKSTLPQPASPDILIECNLAFVRFVRDCFLRGGYSDKLPQQLEALQNMEKSLAASAAKLADIPFVKLLAALFELPEKTVYNDVMAVGNKLSEKDYVNDLKKLSIIMVQDSKKKSEFSSEEAYNTWREQEKATMNQLMLSMVINSKSTARNDSDAKDIYRINAGLTGPSDAESNEVHYNFIPPDVRAYYRHLLRLCLERDLLTVEGKLKSDPSISDPFGDKYIQVLSSESRDFLSTLYFRWRVMSSTRDVLLLDIAKEMFSVGTMSLEMLGNIFRLVNAQPSASANQSHGRGRSLWTLEDKSIYMAGLKNLHTSLMRIIFESVSLVFEREPPFILVTIAFIEKYICLDELFHDNTLEFEENMRMLRTQLKRVTQEKFNETLDDVLESGEQPDPLQIIQLADRTVAIMKRTTKRYTLADFFFNVDISRWAEKLQVASWVAEYMCVMVGTCSRDMFSRIVQHWKAEGLVIGYDDLAAIYARLCEIRDIYKQISRYPFPFQLEDEFFPYFFDWLEKNLNTSANWVDNCITKDQFVPLSDELRHSVSVTDLFSSFHQQLGLIKNLNWENQYHIAKFYTVVLRTISASLKLFLGRLLDFFRSELKEEAEEEREENWLTITRKTMNNSGKRQFQPYTFLPETCVKLNNVEFIKNQLDKLEALIDSESQAAIIASQERGSNSQKVTSYIFTIEIVEAEGIKARDSHEESRPYVEIIDQTLRKRIIKTSTKYKTLNPRWCETFEYNVGSSSTLVARIWNEDKIGKHDECGMCSIRLDPHQYRDFVPKETWIDLRPQGRLKLVISMEGEKDDIQFHFGKAFKEIKKTEDSMVHAIVAKLSMVINYFLSLETIKSIDGSPNRLNKTMNNWLGTLNASSVTPEEAEDAINPLFEYLNANFATLALTLTDTMKLSVMTETWKVVLTTLDLLLLPPLSDRPTKQKPLSSVQVDIVLIWFSVSVFFHNDGAGPPMETLVSAEHFQDIKQMKNYYNLSVEDLESIYNDMSVANYERMQAKENLPMPHLMIRAKSIMAHRNLGTIRAQAKRLRQARQEANTEDIILRLLRLHGQERFLSRVFEQRKKLAEEMTMRSMLRNMNKGFNRMSFIPPYKP